ncbi:MAG: hypothetical protein EKK43_14480 [Methylobacterium sp.]|nr:MAG: hypothetical protein EKK43_14480 [Methylobacterium sp.]
MGDEANLIMEAVTALRAAGVTVAPIADEIDRWQIGDLTFSDADLRRLAATCGRSKMATRDNPTPCRRRHRRIAPGGGRISAHAFWRLSRQRHRPPPNEPDCRAACVPCKRARSDAPCLSHLGELPPNTSPV